MRYLTGILLILAIAFSAFGQGEPHSLYGTLRNSDSSIPSAACLRFCGYFGMQSICFPEDSGVGRIRYIESSGVWLVRADIFDPAPLSGEVVNIYFWNDCTDEGAVKNVTIDLSVPSQNIGSVVLDIMDIEEAKRPDAKGFRAFPNPFNAACAIEGANSAEIYDISGKMISTLSGNGRIFWNGTSASGEDLPSGVYFVKNTADGSIIRVLLMR